MKRFDQNFGPLHPFRAPEMPRESTWETQASETHRLPSATHNAVHSGIQNLWGGIKDFSLPSIQSVSGIRRPPKFCAFLSSIAWELYDLVVLWVKQFIVFLDHPYATPWLFTPCIVMLFFQGLLLTKVLTGTYSSRDGRGSIDDQILINMGALSANLMRARGQGHRLFWSIWLHKDYVHLLVNCLCQIQFMSLLAESWGFLRITATLLISGVSGNLLSTTCNPCALSVGSSGALYGLIASTSVYYLENWQWLPRRRWLVIGYGLTVGYMVIMGFRNEVDAWAHLGGFIGGLIFSLIFLNRVVVSPTTLVDQRKWPAGAVQPSEWKATWIRSGADLVKAKWLYLWSRPKRVETLVRLAAFAILVSCHTVCYDLIFNDYHYKPLGQLKFLSLRSCCCCHTSPVTPNITNYACFYCDVENTRRVSWAEVCGGSLAS